MELVLLPHHNTITSLQELQQEQVSVTADKTDGTVFLPSYPLVCVLARIDETVSEGMNPAVREKQLSIQMRTLKDMVKDVRGTLTFTTQPIVLSEGSGADSPDTLILPVSVPFMDAVKEAGFSPVDKPHIVLGNWCATADKTAVPGKTKTAFQTTGVSALPAPSRSFRLALMQRTPLSEACSCDGPLTSAGQAASFSWKYRDAFWVKLG